MRRSSIRPILLALMLLVTGCERESGGGGTSSTNHRPATESTMDADRAVVDEYLTKWDQFAQGDKQLVPYLRDRKGFEASLARLIRSNDPGAAARLVFYPVVQVGGAIAADSELGKAARELLGADFPVMTTKEGQRILFCADLYAWWQKHQGDFEHFQLFDEWLGA